MKLRCLIPKKYVNTFQGTILYVCRSRTWQNSLLNAIGLELQSENNVMFISAERFMYHFIKSIKKNDMVNFKDFLENPQFL